MVNLVNYGARYRPSVNTGRGALNARYHNNAMNAAMQRSSIFYSGPPVQTMMTIDNGSDFMTGNIIGNIAKNFLSSLPNIIDTGKNIWAKLFG